MTTHRGLPALDPRLRSAASFVRPGSVCADIGTDHAYLPIFLVTAGICPSAVASDINAGPLEKARLNVEAHHLTDKITLLLADGLDGAAPYAPSDILICGMGGELIGRILDRAAIVRDPSVRLVLQPMSRPDRLRAYLSQAGFAIQDERLSQSDGKIYQCICAAWTGVPYQLTDAECLLGPRILAAGERGDGLFTALLHKALAAAERRYRGRTAGSLSTEREAALLRELEKYRVGTEREWKK